MLLSLHIENYALIKQLDLNFNTGFSVVTGETGAGKSIMLGALGLVLGQRADLKTIKEGEHKCIIEASFALQNYNLQSIFASNDVDYEDTTIIRREILTTGKSRMFVNDTPVSIQFLKEIGQLLIDIHSQHENLLLKNNHFQLDIIDLIASNKGELALYSELYHLYKNTLRALVNLQETADKEKNNMDYISFQYEQLTSINLQAGEKDSLNEELQVLSHAEEIKTSLLFCNQLLQNDDSGIVASLKKAQQLISTISGYFPQCNDINERLQSCYIELKDMSSEINKLESSVDYNAERLQNITDRLDTIYSLCQKHKVTDVEELLALQESYKQQLEKIQSFDTEIESLRKECSTLYAQVMQRASDISITRKKAAKIIEKKMVEQLSLLGMPHVQFKIDFTTIQEPQILGIDDVNFLFSSTKNNTPKAVSEIASGGEIARVMLCLKSLIAHSTTLPTIIFDEIDTGVSGEIADKMGNIMKQMSEKMQVICITHLPQIAAKGIQHYQVYKIDGDTSETKVKQLSDAERHEEIAKMLSGSSITDAALKNAEDLLKQSIKR
jgi:DNA repair protein RecN (Recombination protein N)